MMIDIDAPEHVRRRRLVSEGFTPGGSGRARRASGPSATPSSTGCASRARPTSSRDIAAPLPMIVIGNMLGVAPEDRDDLLRWSDDMLKALGSPDPGAMDTAALAADGVRRATSPRWPTQRRRDSQADDLIGTLVHAEIDGDRLDEPSLIYESLLILIGGDETTRHVISGGMYELLRHPDQLAGPARPTGPLLPAAVEEMLRWVSPIKNMARQHDPGRGAPRRDAPAGARSSCCSTRRPTATSGCSRSPSEFDITRTPNDHMAFGFGAHFCLGNRLARMELTVMFDRLLDRLPDLALADEPSRPSGPPTSCPATRRCR